MLATLGGLTLKEFTIPLLVTTLENSVDVTTLDFTMYTDFANRKNEWSLHWAKLDESDYDDLKAIYDSQFSTGDYPTFVFPHYSVDTPVRVYLNERDIRQDGCYMVNVTARLVQKTGF